MNHVMSVASSIIPKSQNKRNEIFILINALKGTEVWTCMERKFANNYQLAWRKIWEDYTSNKETRLNVEKSRLVKY